MTRQLEILSALRFPATMRFLAEKVGCTRNAASTAISRLKRRGLVQSRPASYGRALYRLTAEGRAELAQAAKGRP